jgi:aminoglycoside phosphotransferase (APT) family kinase protein
VPNYPPSTEDLRGRLIAEQFPDLAPVTVTYLGEGYDSTAFDVNGTWVFRFPKRADVEQQQLIERRVLPVLGRHVPLPIPSPRFLGQPTSEFARHFIGYPKIAGLPGNHFERSRFPFTTAAEPLGRFLSALHAFPAADAQRLGVPVQEIEGVIDESRTEALDDFHLVRELSPDAPLGQWHAYLSAGPPRHSGRSASPVLVHNDLAAEHVLCDERTGLPTGVIDWSDMALGDPTVDFAGILHWGGEPFAKALFAHYDGPVDEHCLARARFLAACRGVGDVRFGIEMNRREYITAGIRALEMCAHQGTG